jgi:hypothetical protein
LLPNGKKVIGELLEELVRLFRDIRKPVWVEVTQVGPYIMGIHTTRREAV